MYNFCCFEKISDTLSGFDIVLFCNSIHFLFLLHLISFRKCFVQLNIQVNLNNLFIFGSFSTKKHIYHLEKLKNLNIVIVWSIYCFSLFTVLVFYFGNISKRCTRLLDRTKNHTSFISSKKKKIIIFHIFHFFAAFCCLTLSLSLSESVA